MLSLSGTKYDMPALSSWQNPFANTVGKQQVQSSGLTGALADMYQDASMQNAMKQPGTDGFGMPSMGSGPSMGMSMFKAGGLLNALSSFMSSDSGKPSTKSFQDGSPMSFPSRMQIASSPVNTNQFSDAINRNMMMSRSRGQYGN